jgi:hypothetical protein
MTKHEFKICEAMAILPTLEPGWMQEAHEWGAEPGKQYFVISWEA